MGGDHSGIGVLGPVGWDMSWLDSPAFLSDSLGEKRFWVVLVCLDPIVDCRKH